MDFRKQITYEEKQNTVFLNKEKVLDNVFIHHAQQGKEYEGPYQFVDEGF